MTALTRNAGIVVDGARVLAVDYSSTTNLTDAHRGAEGVFVHLPVTPEEDRLTFARNVVTAVREARPARVVFSTSGALVHPDGDSRRDDSAGTTVSVLAAGPADSAVSHAVIEPRFYLENLLLPHVIAGVREEGVLHYSLPSGFPTSWASHLDIADAATVPFERPDIAGVVSVGQYPGVSGEELAEAFSHGRQREHVPGRRHTARPLDHRRTLRPEAHRGDTADHEPVAGRYRSLTARRYRWRHHGRLLR
ncbi:hydroxylase [Streptomyces sp. ME02-8801-2C]|uniref:SDR family oxidoreductase n=1 Tax=Streptomyces sp. ME02-8801-2C TaxID=3028680 RepID=UPI0029B0E52D|nr:hydroxylase [Streptomyces sp. ME02-8801-2C]MDX3450875.1 hydroxylase [Streptomyces sp. ME02-8801-2C]